MGSGGEGRGEAERRSEEGGGRREEGGGRREEGGGRREEGRRGGGEEGKDDEGGWRNQVDEGRLLTLTNTVASLSTAPKLMMTLSPDHELGTLKLVWNQLYGTVPFSAITPIPIINIHPLSLRWIERTGKTRLETARNEHRLAQIPRWRVVDIVRPA